MITNNFRNDVAKEMANPNIDYSIDRDDSIVNLQDDYEKELKLLSPQEFRLELDMVAQLARHNAVKILQNALTAIDEDVAYFRNRYENKML